MTPDVRKPRCANSHWSATLRSYGFSSIQGYANTRSSLPHRIYDRVEWSFVRKFCDSTWWCWWIFFCFFFPFFWEFCEEAGGMLNGSTRGWFMLDEEWRGNVNCINTCAMVKVGYRLDSLLILWNYSNWQYLDNLFGYSLLPSELYKYLGDRNWLRSWFEFVGNSLGFVEIEGGWGVMRNRNCTNIRVTVEIACYLNSLNILIRNRGDSSVVQWMARE